eukprot:2271567-Lingulodinium_polyedra.AAC.1
MSQPATRKAFTDWSCSGCFPQALRDLGNVALELLLLGSRSKEEKGQAKRRIGGKPVPIAVI